MERFTITLALMLLGFYGFAQDFKSDNVRYQTVSWTDFFKRLEHNPKLVFFDIRTEGERNDVGQSPAFNQGKIRGAI